MQCIAYRLSEILRQLLIDWKIKFGSSSSRPFQKLLVPEEWTDNFLPPPTFEPLGDILNITIVLIIVITRICKSRALNTSTSFHFIFHFLTINSKQNKEHRDILYDWLDWLLILFWRSRMMPCFLFLFVFVCFSFQKTQHTRSWWDEGAFRCQQWGAMLWSWTPGDKC